GLEPLSWIASHTAAPQRRAPSRIRADAIMGLLGPNAMSTIRVATACVPSGFVVSSMVTASATEDKPTKRTVVKTCPQSPKLLTSTLFVNPYPYPSFFYSYYTFCLYVCSMSIYKTCYDPSLFHSRNVHKPYYSVMRILEQIHKFSKILVSGYQHPAFIKSLSDNNIVTGVCACFRNPDHIKTFFPQGFNSIQGDAAINEKFHEAVIKGSILSWATILWAKTRHAWMSSFSRNGYPP